MTKRAQVTKTMNPLHFEDLEPHRFEDIVRQLCYDFREWHSIEPTGRSGNDEGMDIRAFEKRRVFYDDEHTGDGETEYVTEGNQWVFQCKREKTLGPRDVKRIIEEGPFQRNEIYGYVLAAPVNFSKRSYDVFREELRERGVTEFALWGRAELEDKLLMPKNDHILFAFFGVSLVMKRRGRITAVRTRINTKNKLYRIIGEDAGGGGFSRPVLVRDIDDSSYPWKEEIIDFAARPRWEPYVAFDYHPDGLLVHMHRYFAFLDTIAAEYDVLRDIDLLNVPTRYFEPIDEETRDLRQCIEDYWQHLPRCNQAIFEIDGLLCWDDILFIDDKGDGMFEGPHLFVEAKPETNLVSGFFLGFRTGGKSVSMEDRFERKTKFPAKLPQYVKPKISVDKAITLDEATILQLTQHFEPVITLYDIDGRYDSLRVRDVVPIENLPAIDNEFYLEVTYRYAQTVEKYLGEQPEPYFRQVVEMQVGRAVKGKEKLHILECRRVSKWQVQT